MLFRSLTYVGLLALGLTAAGTASAQEPDRIFDKSTVWRPLTPNDKLVVYGVDDPGRSTPPPPETVPDRDAVERALETVLDRLRPKPGGAPRAGRKPRPDGAGR